VTHEEVMRGVSLYSKAIELNKTNVVLYVSLANGYVQAGDLQSAIEAFEEGLIAVPYSIEIRHAYLNFLLFYEVYLEEKALPVVEELSELSDYGMTINLYTGRIELALGDFENAKVYLESVVNYEPENLEAQYYLGVCLTQLNDREGAIRAFENALELDKDYLYTDQIQSILEAIK
jgi:tetratricopeptide (TPR) repeat protein